MMPDWSVRSREPEWMDDEAVSWEDFDACLVDLAAVNRLTLAYRPTLDWLDRVAPALPQDRPLHILDVGSGHGDMLRMVARWAARRQLAVRLTGIDRNPWSEASARAATPPGLPIAYVTCDLFDYRPARPPDIVLSSLFAHHLTDTEIVRFLVWMQENAAIGWFINDLRRSPLSFHGFRLLSAAARWHRFVRHDGPVSISRAFVEADWRRLLALAGPDFTSSSILRHFPFRLCVSSP